MNLKFLEPDAPIEQIKKQPSFFTIEDNVCCGFVIYNFYYVEECSFYSCFLESFYHKWMN